MLLYGSHSTVRRKSIVVVLPLTKGKREGVSNVLSGIGIPSCRQLAVGAISKSRYTLFHLSRSTQPALL